MTETQNTKGQEGDDPNHQGGMTGKGPNTSQKQNNNNLIFRFMKAYNDRNFLILNLW